MDKRHSEILKALSKGERVEVSTLSQLLGVSQVTVRQDLRTLEQQGYLKRIHGGAVPLSTDDVMNRLSIHHDLKQRIAGRAASLIQNGETIMIEAGSTCSLLAEEISKNLRDVTIITNSVFIARFTRHMPNLKVILLGGSYQPESETCVGPVTKSAASAFFVDKLFLGTDGFDQNSGFTGVDPFRNETVRAMGQQAAKRIILTESRKFSQRGVAQRFETREINIVVTDSGIPEKTRLFLENNGVKVVAV